MNPLPTKPNRWRPITVFNLLVGLLFSLSTLAQPAFLKDGLVADYSLNNSIAGLGCWQPTLLNPENISFKNGYATIDKSRGGIIFAGNACDISGAWTVSFFVTHNGNNFLTTDNATIFSRSGMGANEFDTAVAGKGDGVDLLIKNGAIRIGIYSDQWIYSEPIQLPMSKTHVVIIENQNSCDLYLNGNKVTSVGGKPFYGTKSFRFGVSSWSNMPSFLMGVNSVKIYNRSLIDSEIKALYDYESTPPDNSFITNGLVAYYPFNGNANDESGNGKNGSPNNLTFAGDRINSTGGSADFDGSSSFIKVSQKLPDSQELSFSVWIKSRTDKFSCIFYDSAYFTAGRDVFLRTQGPLSLVGTATKIADPGPQAIIAKDAFKLNLWTHIAWTLGPSGMRLYRNGTMIQSTLEAANNVGYHSDVHLGAENHGPKVENFFNGQMDDVRIYNRALSDGEVKALYDYESASPIQSPVFVSQPVSKTVNSGDNVVLSVGLQATGTYNYQWQLNEQNIAGATASSLSVNNAVAGVYRYRVIVSNSAGTIISDTATLTVSTPPAPSIVTQPAPKTVQEGANVSLNVVATGQGSIVYQWQFNEQNLPGATSATLNLNGVKLNTAGRYRVLISSQYGVTISDTVTLTVNANPPPTIVTQPLSRTPTEGTQVSLTVTATGLGSLTYQWQINNQNIPGATSSTLVLSAVRPSANGNYRVIIGNPYGTTISTEASITVVVTDSDSDGLSDYEELLLGTNANKADSDGDGLSDFAEVRTHGSNPLTTDTDGDGYSDGIEVARDGNPNNRSVTPTGALAVFPAVDVEFYTLNGVKYQLEVSTDMVQWTAQGGLVVGNGGSQNHLVRASKATQFWRLKVVQ
jgi:hypothetical protein